MAKKMFIELDEIRTDGLQMRAQINNDVVREYAEEEREHGAVFPPVTVFRDSAGAFWLADGFHRLEVARQNGRKKIAAEVHDGEYLDALKHALMANVSHGLRRTNEDKRQAVRIAYEHRIELGLSEVPAANAVAEKVGVSDHFVANQLRTVRSWREATERMGADGKMRTLPPIPTRQPSPIPTRRPQPDDEQAPPPVRPASAMQPPTVRPASALTPPPVRRPERHEEEAGLCDERERPIPPDLLEMWNRRQEVRDLAALVSRVRVALRDAQDGNDPLWSEINFGSALAHLDMAYKEIAAAEPWCVCPMCQGIGCNACKGRGLMGKYRFENVVPKNMR